MTDQEMRLLRKDLRFVILYMFLIFIFLSGMIFYVWSDMWKLNSPVHVSSGSPDYLNTSRIYISQGVALIWDSRFRSDMKEFEYCIYGKPYKDGYLISRISESAIIDSGASYLDSLSCKDTEDLLGTVHSHPHEGPDLSSDDIFSFGQSGYQFMGIIYGSGRYAMYGITDFRNPYPYSII